MSITSGTSLNQHLTSEILFSERQKFDQWWIWLILLFVNGFIVLGVYRQFLGGEQFGDKPMSDVGLLIAAGLTLLFTILFLNFRLETQIKNDGVYVRFFPFHVSYKHFSWEKISKSFVREYHPISEYGGWGIRLGLFGKGRAYNVSGNVGLQLEFHDHKKLLIGTRKPEELRTTLEKIGQIRK